MKKTFRKSVQDLLSVRAGRLVNLAGVFLVAGTLSLSASTYATEHMLSLNLKNATIREAIESIKSQSEFSFSLDVKDLNLDEKVSVSLDNKTSMKYWRYCSTDVMSDTKSMIVMW